MLYDMIERLLDLYEQDRGITHDPETGEIIIPDGHNGKIDKDHHNPYL